MRTYIYNIHIYKYIYVDVCTQRIVCNCCVLTDFHSGKMMRVVRMICDVHEKVNLSIPFCLFFHSCSVYTHGSLSLSFLSYIHSESFLSPAPVMLSQSPLPSFLPLSFLWFGSARIYFLISYPIVFLFVRFRMIQGNSSRSPTNFKNQTLAGALPPARDNEIRGLFLSSLRSKCLQLLGGLKRSSHFPFLFAEH